MSYAFSSWLFTRALSLIYVIAFVSLAVQARGLWGSHGLAPIPEYLRMAEAQLGSGRFWQLPSMFWLHSSDTLIVGLAWIGAIFALLAFAGVAQGWMLAVCFLIYLSYVSVGRDFLSFQWDILLLEVGFVALFAVPWTLTCDWERAVEPHWIVRTMFMVILFKLMFLSGVVKLLSGDSSWRDMTALTYHYWTQPLPNPLSAFVHALPKWLHQLATLLTFIVELVFPFLLFFARTRWIAFIGFVGLSLMIFATGNYTFFNFLTVILCLWLIPDQIWKRFGTPVLELVPATDAAALWLIAPMGILMMISFIWCTRWFYPDALSRHLNGLLQITQTLHISNSYGLFANMTKNRSEIVIEGSLDGNEWREYEFKYKPGNLHRAPPVVAPHQPRLDWQMWFAALGSFERNRWLQMLMVRIFEARPEVMRLLAGNPFPDEPPKFLRARLYEYQFASPGEILRQGQWWKRTLIGEYSPTFQKGS